MELTKEYLNELFEYRDGNLYRKISRNSRHKVGDKAGYRANRGYMMIGIDGTYYLIHRLIWLMHHGSLPEMIDHKDGDKSNNRIDNLRASTRSENNSNCRLRSNNTSGIKGVRWRKDQGKWHAYIRVNKKGIHLGYYDDIELAELVATEARNKYHKEFARHS